MEPPVSLDQFKINHLLKRIAVLSLEHEDALAKVAVQNQILTQECDVLRAEVERLEQRLSEEKTTSNSP